MFQLKQLERQYQDVDLQEMQPGGPLYFTENDVAYDPGIAQKICGIYQKVRPFLSWASGFFLIPKKVRAVVSAFILLMDRLCP